MNMIKAIILENNINDDQWPKLVFTITYIENNWSTKVSQNFSLYKTSTYKLLNLSHFQILGSNVYIFLHKEKRMLKLEK